MGLYGNSLMNYMSLNEASLTSFKGKKIDYSKDLKNAEEEKIMKDCISAVQKDYDKILTHIAEFHKDYVDTCYKNTPDNDRNKQYRKMLEKYDTVEKNKKALKIMNVNAGVFENGSAFLELVFDSEVIEKDEHSCFAVIHYKNGKINIDDIEVSFEG